MNNLSREWQVTGSPPNVISFDCNTVVCQMVLSVFSTAPVGFLSAAGLIASRQQG